MKIGDCVKVGYYCGIIDDIAVSQKGIVMLSIKSVKELRVKGRESEWIQYEPDNVFVIDEKEFIGGMQCDVRLANDRMTQVESLAEKLMCEIIKASKNEEQQTKV